MGKSNKRGTSCPERGDDMGSERKRSTCMEDSGCWDTQKEEGLSDMAEA